MKHVGDCITKLPQNLNNLILDLSMPYLKKNNNNLIKNLYKT